MRLHIISLHLLLLLLLLPTPTLPCHPGRNYYPQRRSASHKRTPFKLHATLPAVPETNLGASGVPEGSIRNFGGVKWYNHSRGGRVGEAEEVERWGKMVVNRNPGIIFKNDRDERRMSKRCNEKLNQLAELVRKQWPGVRLRVTQAWKTPEADKRMPDVSITNSQEAMHAEGRAVDITTSDRDRTKYGLLARLAFEAGFDWVSYESKSHIHCSVKSDSFQAFNSMGCFPADALLVEESNQRPIKMSALRVGQKVLTLNAQHRPVYTQVVAFLHRSAPSSSDAEDDDEDDDDDARYLEVRLEGGGTLTLSDRHLVFVVKSHRPSNASSIATDGDRTVVYRDVVDAFTAALRALSSAARLLFRLLTSTIDDDVTLDDAVDITTVSLPTVSLTTVSMEAVFAADLTSGDLLAAVVGGKDSRTFYRRVEGVRRVKARGSYAPLTAEGTILVDGVFVSCYAHFSSHNVAQWVVAPLRLGSYYYSHSWPLTLLAGYGADSQPSGLHWYPSWLLTIFKEILPTNFLS